MIPVNEPVIAKNAQKYVDNCIKTGWVSSSGKYIELFEKAFAKYLNTKYAVTTTSGTTALHLALAALGIGKNDEVIIPDLTIISCAAAVIYTGATPVLVDVNPTTGVIDPEEIEKHITKRTKAIMPVHLYGYACDMAKINRLAKKHKLFVIEDGAEALGTEYKGKKVGSLSDVGCFSFYGNKLITTGEGGMVVTNTKKVYEKLKLLKNLAHSPQRRFLHEVLGFNYRMTNLQAALGFAQLEEIRTYIKKKDVMYKLYFDGFKKNPNIQLPKFIDPNYVSWMFTIVLSKNPILTKLDAMKRLKEQGVDTREYFIPLHRQPVLKKLRVVDTKQKFPASEYLANHGFYIPSGLALTTQQIKKVIQAVNTVLSYD